MNKLLRIRFFQTALLACSLLTGQQAVAQRGNHAALFPVVQRQADSLAGALLRKDNALFVRLTYPGLVKKIGGEEAYIALLEKSMEDVEEQGFKMTGVSVDLPKIIVRQDSTLQCTVTEHITLKSPTGTIKALSTLIAVSEDAGKSWRFLDTSGRNIEEMRAIFPELSAALIIPKKEQPQFLPE